jgi:pyruvate/2-oxoglutarate dehydrogenase complex dihydrolipoamide acyltransferase (E2) component
MQLRLEVPATAKTIESMRVRSWSKAEGDPVAFGDELCVITIGRKRVLKRDAPVRARAERRRGGLFGRKPPPEDEHRLVRSTGVVLRVVASDEGVVRRLLVDAGEKVESGTLLAVITTTGDEPVDLERAPSTPAFRAIAETESLSDDDAADELPQGLSASDAEGAEADA